MSMAFTTPNGGDFPTLLKELLITYGEHQGAMRTTEPYPYIEWNGTATYATDQMVRYDGDFWISLQAANIGNTPAPGSAWWRLSIIDPGLAPESVQEGDTLTSQVSVIAMLQAWLLKNCSAVWVDYQNSEFDYYSDRATWFANSGLDSRGFRRARNWTQGSEPQWIWPDPAGDWPWGIIERGDIIGYWIWEDLQKAFSSLRWTFWSSGVTEAASRYGRGPGSGNDLCVDAKATYDLSWSNAAWQDQGNSFYGVIARKIKVNLTSWLLSTTYQTGDIVGHDLRQWSSLQDNNQGHTPVDGGGWWNLDNLTTGVFDSYRYRGKATMDGHYTGVPHTADCYIALNAASDGVFNDLDGLGFNAGRNLVQSFGESSSAEHTTSIIGDIQTSPVGIMGWGCPWGQPDIQGCQSSGSRWRLKWNFTYQGGASY